MNLNFRAFLESFRIMGIGLLGIFAIVFIIIIVVQILIKLFPDKED